LDSVAKVMTEHMNIGVIVLDSDLCIQHWNHYLNSSCGAIPGSAKGKPFVELFPGVELQELRALVDHVLSEKDAERNAEYPALSVCLPGSEQPMSLDSRLCFAFQCQKESAHIGLVFSDPAPVARPVARHSDLVEQLELANRQLLQSEKLAAIGQLAAGVAHEINNPIGYVSSNLKTLADYVRDMLQVLDSVDTADNLEYLRQYKKKIEYDHIRSDIEDLLSESEEGIQRVKQIIKALKDFSYIEEEEFRFADLHWCLDSTLNLINSELKYKVEIRKDYAELPHIECLPSQINQVIMNLLLNAGQAIEQSGIITLRTGQAESWVWLEVEDTGKGIEPHLLNRLYEPFFTTKPIGKGTGLGLSLSYNIVNKHSGRIEVTSTPGAGARFRVWLPVSREASLLPD
jgi:two-component system NtrC family sensor kinase